MTTLTRRATPQQNLIMRMVKGAVINAAHAHPDWTFDPRLAPSIAKRAAGTLTAQWPDVLAAQPSDADAGYRRASAAPGGVSKDAMRRGAAKFQRGRAPIALLRSQVGRLCDEAKRAGQTERYEALVEVLRLIAKVTGDATG